MQVLVVLGGDGTTLPSHHKIQMLWMHKGDGSFSDFKTPTLALNYAQQNRTDKICMRLSLRAKVLSIEYKR